MDKKCRNKLTESSIHDNRSSEIKRRSEKRISIWREIFSIITAFVYFDTQVNRNEMKNLKYYHKLSPECETLANLKKIQKS